MQFLNLIFNFLIFVAFLNSFYYEFQVFKIEFHLGLTFWQVFTPLFIATAFNHYFLFIVFIRAVIHENDCKTPFIK